MTAIVLDLEDTILAKALQECLEHDYTLSEYITEAISSALEIPIIKKPSVNINELIETALIAAENKSIGTEFMLTDVCPSDVWENLSGGDRKSLGKGFRKAAESQKPTKVVFDRRTTGNKAVYKRV